ncbi:MAG: hypothetical protein EOP84_19980, partial [Verrucomicrobiaceae bacterium]
MQSRWLPQNSNRRDAGSVMNANASTTNGSPLKITLIGGSGLIGRKLAPLLEAQGHKVIIASPSRGVNTLTGEGLAEAVKGSQVVVDVTNSPSFEENAVCEFFDTSTRNILAACIAITAASCSDDTETTTLESVNFQAQIEATPGAIVLSPANKYQSVLTVSWPKVTYPVDAPVTYALQFDVASDTIGATAWSHSVRLDAGSDVLSKSFMGGELNDLAKDLGLPADLEGQLVVRVEASLDRAVYSPGIAITVTPFTE